MASKSEEWREIATRRGLDNREKFPDIVLWSNGLLRACLGRASALVRQHHAANPKDPQIRKDIEAYFAYRYEYDYRQAQGC